MILRVAIAYQRGRTPRCLPCVYAAGDDMGDRTYANHKMERLSRPGAWPVSRMVVRGRGTFDAYFAVGSRWWQVSVVNRFSGVVVRTLSGSALGKGTMSRSVVQAEVEGMLRKVSAEERAKASMVQPVDATFAKVYPDLFEFLTADAYPDGQTRVRATLLVLCDGDLFKACINDRDNEMSHWVTGTSFGACMKAAEAAVNCPTTPWRANKAWKDKPKKSR